MEFFVEAGVLAEIFPERRAELFEYAHRLAWGRVIGGVHYPTDLAGGQVLAEAILERLKGSAAFQAALARSRAEVAPFGAAKVGGVFQGASLELCLAGT
jgi:acid phosphatase (class A)